MEQFKFYKERLRASGLRPTKQRLAICKILFDRKETFHFTIEKLKKILEKDNKKKNFTSYFIQHSSCIHKKKSFKRNIIEGK